MAINYHELKNWQFPDITQSYIEKDAMLYALGVGVGADPLDPGQLRYTYEKELSVLPTMPVVLCHPGQWVREPRFGLDWARIVHGDVSVELHGPLPTRTTFLAKTKNTAVVDKGDGKHAVIRQERQFYDQDAGHDSPIVTIKNTYIALGQGGFSKDNGLTDELSTKTSSVPERTPDLVCDLNILPQAALIYRLSGDYNPLHCDPAFAAKVGYPRPILQGLCTFGVAGYAVLKSCLNYDAKAIKGLAARFSSPVYPGEAIRTELWREDSRILFRCHSVERKVVVLDAGEASIA
jgi:acyl dehydratase